MAVSKEDVQIARDLYNELRGVTSELKGQESSITKSRKAYRAFEDVAQKMAQHQEGISKLNDKELSSLQKRLTEQTAIAKQEVARLGSEKQLVGGLMRRVAIMKEEGASADSISDTISSRLSTMKELTEEEKALIAASLNQENIVGRINNNLDGEIARRKEVNKSLGIAGAAVKTLANVGGPLAEAFGLKQMADDMEEFADESSRAGKSVSKLQTLGAGLKSGFGSLTETLTDPSVIIGKILKDYGEFEKANKEVRQLTGQTASNYSSFNGSLVSATDQVKTIGSLSKELGINVNAAFSPDTILAATELTELLGLGVKETAQLSMNAEAFGQDLSTFPKSAERVTKQFALSGKGALNMGDVLKEAGSASGALSLSLKGNPDALVKAAAGAKSLGLSLAQAEGIADSLLDFESSIQAEMEAELLTGKSLNLEKARSAALNNDIAGLTEEIGKNQEILSAFSSGNRIEQTAVAKALGMSKDEVAKMIVLQKISDGMTTAQAAAAADISIEEATRLGTQDQLNKALEKMTTAFAPILNFFASILSNSVVLYGTLTAIAAVMTVKMLGGAREFASEMKDSVESTADMAKNMAKGFSEGKGIGGKIMGAAKGALGLNETPEVPEVPDVEAISATPGDQIKNTLTGLAEGLKAMGDGKVFAGIGAVALAGPAFIIALPSIPFLLFMGLTPLGQLEPNFTGLGNGLKAMSEALAGTLVMAAAGPALALGTLAIPFLLFMGLTPLAQLEPNFTGLGEGLTSMSGTKVLQGALNLLPAALGFVAMTAGTIGLGAIALMGNLAGTGLKGLSGGLKAFAKAMASPTPLGPVGLVAPIALALLGTSLIPFAFALNLAAPAMKVFGDTLVGALSALPLIISAVAEGFVSILGAVSPENILGMMMLGPALISASVGMVTFGLALAAGGIGSFFGGGILDQIKELSTVGPGVAAAGAGLAAVAGNIDIISLSMQGLSESIQNISTSLLGLGGLASPLFALAGGLMSISTGLAAVAVSGIFALPIFAALKSVAVVAPVLEKLGKLFGVGDSESADADSTGAKGSSVSSDITLLAEKLDQMNLTLNALLVKEGTVTLDGSKVGTALTVGSYKLQ
jgi:hypothetical protein